MKAANHANHGVIQSLIVHRRIGTTFRKHRQIPKRRDITRRLTCYNKNALYITTCANIVWKSIITHAQAILLNKKSLNCMKKDKARMYDRYPELCANCYNFISSKNR